MKISQTIPMIFPLVHLLLCLLVLTFVDPFFEDLLGPLRCGVQVVTTSRLSMHGSKVDQMRHA